ncbi:PHP domain-containing protein [Lachnoclostridium phytofermentans]|uniref:PHP domain protein n=1 Tax=Lachnoclostridium phytofermentans (strain ATCC 700394 / DSM 18823 / ISDg) TaxID=357809 RepID=A9KKF2_LACP7|nr:PHP domain-containing protein [Lachnoclostridium phytofermentans]ABX44143.1 PHP domain protein [Lachnoclostridium phytofermentans ISDg]
MIPLTYDFHIHTCLSPCADDDMTPTNIVMMAALKGLDVIAITDHNTCRNCKIAIEIGKKNNILVLPGMELTTSEEVHVICLFAELEDAMLFDSYVYEHLIKVKNKESIFGNQLVVDEDEKVVEREEYLLINATTIGFSDVYEIVTAYRGVMIPAHIDKNSNSVISNLGFLPPDSRFSCVEFTKLENRELFVPNNPYLHQCNVISDSDAHNLGQISEPIHLLSASMKSATAVLKALENMGY